MPVWAIIVVVVVVVIIALIIAGMAANARWRHDHDADFQVDVANANRALAAAHADDKGWDRTALEAAARQAVEDARPGAAIQALHLIEVIDNPGVEHDKAIFLVDSNAGSVRLELGREAGGWVAERVG